MELIEKLIMHLSPEWAAKRAYYQAQAQRLYEAGKLHPQHRKRGQQGSADRAMNEARSNIRDWARWLDENHDIAIGILDDLVNKTVGAGVAVMPLVVDANGNMLRELNIEINRLWRIWTKRPEVTHEYNFNQVQRLMSRTMFRDGEVLGQHVLGQKGRVVHGSRIPYSLEMIEGDYLPFELNDEARNIVHGVEKTAWGRPRAYHLYKKAPDFYNTTLIRPNSNDTKRVVAENMLHAKFARRIGQTRGVSIFHGVVHRLDDIKDYEESERLAARIGGAMAAYIRKGTDFNPASALDENGNLKTNRTQEIIGGMIYDDLLPGEDVGTIDTNRPNTALEDFRSGQIRMLATGTMTQYSSISKNYDGTYSSQRQELVESMAPYAALRDYQISAIFQPIYEQFLTAAVLSNQLAIPAGLELEQLFAAGWIAPPQPWVDPKKEIEADALAVDSHFVPWSHVVLQRTGRDPEIVLEQMRREKEMLDEVFPPVQPVAEADNISDDPEDEDADDVGEDSDDDTEAA